MVNRFADLDDADAARAESAYEELDSWWVGVPNLGEHDGPESVAGLGALAWAHRHARCKRPSKSFSVFVTETNLRQIYDYLFALSGTPGASAFIRSAPATRLDELCALEQMGAELVARENLVRALESGQPMSARLLAGMSWQHRRRMEPALSFDAHNRSTQAMSQLDYLLGAPDGVPFRLPPDVRLAGRRRGGSSMLRRRGG